MHLIVIIFFLKFIPLMAMENYYNVHSGTPIETEIRVLQDEKLTVVAFGNSITAIRNTIHQVYAQRLYVNTVRTLSKTYQTGLVDNFKLFMDFQKNTGNPIDDLLLDGVHPNDVGHQLIAEELAKEIIHIMK